MTKPSSQERIRRRRGRPVASIRSLVLSTFLSSAPVSMAACISMQGSTACPAFQSASVSNDDFIVGLFSFMRFVSNTQNFDDRLKEYVRTSYVQEKYQTLLGCGGINLSNTTEQYARFTTTTICNALVQNSIDRCSLRAEQSRPVCAETCAQFAQSEALIASDGRLCANAGSNAQRQIRADFTNCALPANSLSSQTCIQGITNEPENCGYGTSTIGLCSYCASGGINSTDTCCYTSNAQNRCAGVVLPTVIPSMSLPTVVPTSTGTPAPSPERNGLSGGAIAGIVIGSIIGFALIAALIFVCILLRRRRRGSQSGSIFNQPSPARRGGTSTSQVHNVPSGPNPQGYEVLPGGRIARMSALEGHTGDSPSRHGYGGRDGRGLPLGAAAVGAAAGYGAGRSRGGDNQSSSDDYAESPEPEPRVGVLRPPPAALRRHGSLSSGSALGEGDPNSPGSAGGMSSSPPGMASQQSEQLPFFKDYYSQDDIHPGDKVSVLWAYQPRAADEFTLERGDMLKIVGIWDDGWATGVLLDERADEWEARRHKQRDSGVSHTSGPARDVSSPPASGEIKAFPLVCVCLPEHWRKTIDSDGSTEAGSSGYPV
ncbi:hypothetical protein PpBr36_02928 [Pyricularia pennisetigena]|uniref:hypothetical protein n=1 Tax=Pyricularia pennisetigena TaxID=1578925 RepID=UPI001150AAFA|nr:hypothetical protein PpBr36_02928 [Pyricularia pennisetigena]TLS30435.1 hypothetical protein PpBr36_02928 [Pyricularia pennisetigena]